MYIETCSFILIDRLLTNSTLYAIGTCSYYVLYPYTAKRPNTVASAKEIQERIHIYGAQ